MSNPDHIYERLETIVGVLKYLNSLMRIRDLGFGMINSDPGYRMEKIRIRDKHPGSATLHLNGGYPNEFPWQ
jgi:hypothetical protein